MFSVYARQILRIAIASVALALGIVLLTPAVALADGVFTFYGHSPAGPGGTTSSAGASISVYADSTNTFPATDAYYQLLLDGVPITYYPEYLGHWEDDGCETWFVVEDYTVMRLSAYLTLADGPHTVTARFRDSAGRVDETTWTFTTGAPPVVTGNSPLQGTSNARPSIRAKITDNNTGAPTVVVRLDGQTVPATFTWPSGDVSYQPPVPLSDDTTHTVVIEATDPSGNRTVFPWTFLVRTGAAATWTNQFPAPGATVSNTSTTLRVLATSPYNLSRYSTAMWVDGAFQNSTSSQPVPTQLQLNANLYTLADGPHTVRARVRDINNIESEYAWSFNVAVLPTVSYQTPAPASSVAVPRPDIGFTMTDNMSGPLHALMTVDGVVVVDADMPQGTVRWRPPSDYANPSTHTVAVVVTDAAGNTRMYSWMFRAASIPAMSTEGNCVGCHDQMAHPVGQCSLCHVSVPYYDEHGGSPAAPLGACWECHGGESGHGPDVLGNCAYCHSGEWTQIPKVHTSAEYGPLHATTTTGCTQCHEASLIAEHGKYPDDVWYKYQCVVCHASADADIRTAITSGVTGCAACHDDLEHRGLHVSTTGAGCFFGECHNASKNLMDVHAGLAGPGSAHPEYATSCDLCHENPSVDTSVSGTACRGSCHSASPGRVPRLKVSPPGR